ncbi:MAG: hypothetical protein ACREJC_08955, partial [Tepidisphaeraceae bacterium]
MPFQLDRLDSFPLDCRQLQQRIDRLLECGSLRHRRLWNYYRNPLATMTPTESTSDRPYRQAQEWGLPARITGVRRSSDPAFAQQLQDIARKEVVIENDIAWRIDAMVDFVCGGTLTIKSVASDP